MVAIVQKIVLGAFHGFVDVLANAKAGLAHVVRQNLLSRMLEITYLTSTASTSTEETVSATS
jgi:hypothetical protein